MAVISIRHLPDPILRERTRRIRSLGPSVERLVDDMVATMHAERGVGVAANQVGSLLRIAVIEVPRELVGVAGEDSLDDETEAVDDADVETDRYILVNPEIVRRAGVREVDEGCLSLPGWRGRLTRSERVTARALDLNGREYRIRARGLLAQALEHETDHLNGVVYIDRMERIDDLWPLTALGESGIESADGSSPERAWRWRRPVSPVVRRS